MSAQTPTPAELGADGVSAIRLTYPCLHGVQRGKDIPLRHFERISQEGIAFCAGIYMIDLGHEVVTGMDEGLPDVVAMPDLSTLRRLPWETEVATCIADLVDAKERQPYPADPRQVLRRAIERLGAHGLAPVVGPELEFYLCDRDPGSARGWKRYVDNVSSVYTVGPMSDPRGLSLKMLQMCDTLGLDAFAVNHEFMNGQYEINLRHSGALDAADRAFRFKAAVKEMAALEGMMATFMGRPWNDQGGSGFHMHLSLQDLDGRNASHDPSTADGLSLAMRQFIAGLIEHASALMAFMNPTINAYKRIEPYGLVPTHANWGYDNRSTFVRVPDERGGATRLELRVGDGAANVYLAIAAALVAGLDGIERGLDPGDAIEGDAYAHASPGGPLPQSLGAAIDALEADEALHAGMGAPLIQLFLAAKQSELRRFHAFVTDWEFSEYSHLL